MSKEKRDPFLYVQDVLDSIERIEEYSSGLKWEEFRKNNLVIDAIVTGDVSGRQNIAVLSC